MLSIIKNIFSKNKKKKLLIFFFLTVTVFFLVFKYLENNIQQIISEGKKIESNSNQILEFTKEVKKMNNDNKIKIVETLWRIIYSNKEADIYETGLMRKLAGLLYIDGKTMGNIKEKIKKEISK